MNDADAPHVLFDPLPVTDAATAATLHDRLTAAADAAGLLDIAYRTLDTPVGRLLLAATEQGLVRIAFEVEDHDRVLASLAGKVSPRILEAPGRLDDATRQIAGYLDGERTSFDLALDLRLSSGFRREVLGRLTGIAYGHTASYAEVAASTGRPRAVRAVGTACATNPLPLVVPCHRVVRSDGGFGGYLGGLEVKRQLLELEAA